MSGMGVDRAVAQTPAAMGRFRCKRLKAQDKMVQQLIAALRSGQAFGTELLIRPEAHGGVALTPGEPDRIGSVFKEVRSELA